MPRRAGRTKAVPIRFSEREWLRIQFKAETAGLKPSEYVRRAALQKQLPPKIPEANGRTYAELHQIGINLNQLARAANTALKHGHTPAIGPEEIEALERQLRQLQRELVRSPAPSELDAPATEADSAETPKATPDAL